MALSSYVHVDFNSITKAINTIINAFNARTITTQANTTYTLALADAATILNNTNASAVTVTIPTNASVAFPIGSEVNILSSGAGGVTISGAGGVTLNGSGAVSQNARKLLLKTGTNTWVAL